MSLFKKDSITDSEVSEQIGIMEKKAERIVNDKSRFDRFLTRAARYVRKAKKLPVIGEVAEDCATMIELLRDWGEKRYTALPIRSITLSVAALAYLLSPLDLIPDQLPVIGFVDDLSVITGVLKLGISADLDRYREWQNKNEKNLRRERIDSEIERLASAVNGRILIGCFITDEGRLVLSVTDTDEDTVPTVSELITLELPEWTGRMEVSEIMEFYDEVLLDHSFRRSTLGRVSVAHGDVRFSQPSVDRESDEQIDIENDSYHGISVTEE